MDLVACCRCATFPFKFQGLNESSVEYEYVVSLLLESLLAMLIYRILIEFVCFLAHSDDDLHGSKHM